MIIPKEAFTQEFYSEALVTLTGAAEMNCFGKDYKALAESVTSNIANIAQGRCEVRLQQFRADADKELNSAKFEFQKKKDKAIADLSDAAQTLATKEAELEGGKLEIEQRRSQLNELRALFDSGDQGLTEGKAQIAEARATLNELQTQKRTLEETIAKEEARIAEEERQLQKDAPYITNEEYYARSMKIIQDTAAVEYYKNQLPALDQSIQSVNSRVSTAEAFIANYPEAAANARVQIAEGEKQLEEAEKNILDGEIQLERAKEDYQLAQEDMEAEISAAEEKLKKSEDEINNVAMPKWHILDRSSIASYAAYKNDADGIGAVGTVFPIIFFLVAALVSLTTMTRMVEEERTARQTARRGARRITVAVSDSSHVQVGLCQSDANRRSCAGAQCRYCDCTCRMRNRRRCVCRMPTRTFRQPCRTDAPCCAAGGQTYLCGGYRLYLAASELCAESGMPQSVPL